MNKDNKIYLAGHTGLVGSSIFRNLKSQGYTNIVGKTIKELDLRNQAATEEFILNEKPDVVILAAAKVGGIVANNTYKAEFIYDNLMIAANVIHASYKAGVKKLLNLGSSCIYPKLAPQPLKEEYLLTDTLEPTNEPYAIAKIAAIKLCRYYNEQYGTNYMSLMPTNMYGPHDNFNLMTSHVLPALIRKMHLGKCLETHDMDALRKDLNRYPIDGVDGTASEKEILAVLKKYGISLITHYSSPITQITLWGTGSPFREFMYVDDLSDAIVFLMEQCNYDDIGEVVNVGTGKDITIKDLAQMIKKEVGFKGELDFDASKPDGTPKKLLDVSKINKMGWNAGTPLIEGLKKSYKWYVSHRIETD